LERVGSLEADVQSFRELAQRAIAALATVTKERDQVASKDLRATPAFALHSESRQTERYTLTAVDTLCVLRCARNRVTRRHAIMRLWLLAASPLLAATCLAPTLAYQAAPSQRTPAFEAVSVKRNTSGERDFNGPRFQDTTFRLRTFLAIQFDISD